MNRRRFLRGLFYGAAVALLAAPKSVLERLSKYRFTPGSRTYHFVHTWDGSTRRTWIDGEEVFGGSVQGCNDVTISDGFYRIPGMEQGSISFWITPPDETQYFNGAIDEVEVHGSKISWTRISDDSPFEPPPRADPPPVVDGDIGEGEDLVDSW